MHIPNAARFTCGILLVVTPLIAVGQDLTTGLVAHYRFDGSLTDSSGAGLSLTPGGTFSFIADHAGNMGSAVQLTTAAANGTFFLGTGPDLAGSSSSVAFWVRKDYPGDGTNGSWVFGLGHPAGIGGSTGEDMHVALDYGSSIDYSFFHDDFDLSTPVSSFAWHHLAFTFDEISGTRRAYLDGMEIGSSASAFGFSGGSSLKIGYAGISLDDLRFYDVALSSSDIAVLAAIPEPSFSAVAIGVTALGFGTWRWSRSRKFRQP